jgi:hypothetical protein
MVGVSLCDRSHDRMIGGDICPEDRPVDRLRRIVLGIDILSARRMMRAAGTSATAQHQREDDGRRPRPSTSTIGVQTARRLSSTAKLSRDWIIGFFRPACRQGGLFLSLAHRVRRRSSGVSADLRGKPIALRAFGE